MAKHRPIAIFCFLAVGGFAGCLAQTEANGAEAQDDGTLPWLLPFPSELPEGLALESEELGLQGNWLGGQVNPGPASKEAVDYAGLVAGRPKAPTEAFAAVYRRTADPQQGVVVLAMRFDEGQAASDWRAYEERSGDGRQTDSGPGEDDGFAIFFAVCGLRPHYGFVRGRDAVLVIGALDIEEARGDEVYRASQELSSTLIQRTGGQDLCSPKERQINAAVHAEPPVNDGNDIRPDAEKVSFGSWTREIAVAGDVDWYAADVEGEAAVCVWLSADYDAAMELHAEGENGETLDLDAQPLSADGGWQYTIHPAPGLVYLRVTAQDPGQVVESYNMLMDSEAC